MHICVFEDQYYRNLLPLVYTRPVYELRSGIKNLLSNIISEFKGVPLTLTARRYLTELLAEKHPGIPINNLPEDDTLFLNGRILRIEDIRKFIGNNLTADCIFRNGEDVAALYCGKKGISAVKELLNEGIPDFSLLKGCHEKEFTGKLIRHSWDLIHNSVEEIEREFQKIRRFKTETARIYRGAHIINRKNIFLSRHAIIKPGAVIDAEKGPVIIGRNVTVMPNAVIQGPAYIGDYSLIKAGATIYPGTSIGEFSKVGGEVECSIIQSYSNKQHSGYLGHSYLGSWVNLGADTNTSDLKNNYSTVRVYVDGLMVDSGEQFVGLTMGDHSKSGINVMFDTGTVAGVCCNIYGAGIPPKFMPSFSWGGGSDFTQYDADKSIEAMRKVMARRSVDLSLSYERMIRHIFQATAGERLKAGLM